MIRSRNRHRRNQQRRPQTVWLDHLPLAVCVQIHSMLPQYKLTKDPYATYQSIHHPDYHHQLSTLDLAAVSPFQREAAILAQNHTLHAEYVNDFDHAIQLISSWRNVFGNDVRQILLSNFIDYTPHYHLHNTLSLPSITDATIPNHPVLFKSFIAAHSLRSLQVELSILRHNPADGHPHLAHVIEACPIEKIQFKCDTCIRGWATCYAASCFEKLKNRPKCHSVRSVHIECTGRRLETLAELVFVFPNLQHLTLQHAVADPGSMFDDNPTPPPFCLTVDPSLAKNLKALTSVNLIHCASVDKFAPMLPHNLTTIITKTPVSSDDVRKLGTCTNLRVIELCFQEAADTKFPQTLRALESVKLAWPCHDEDSRPGEGYLTPANGLLTGLVSRNPIEDFQLQHANISDELLDELLQLLGSRLRKLRIPLGNGPQTRVKRTLRLLMKYNLNLTELKFGSHDSELYTRLASDVHESNGFCDPDWCEVCNKRDEDDCDCDCYCPECDCRDCGCECECEYACQKSDAMSVITQVVKRRLPQLSIDSINRIRWMMGIAERFKKDCAVQ